MSLATVAFGVLLAISEYLGYTDKTEAASISEIVFNSAKALTTNRSVPSDEHATAVDETPSRVSGETVAGTPINVKQTAPPTTT